MRLKFQWIKENFPKTKYLKTSVIQSGHEILIGVTLRAEATFSRYELACTFLIPRKCSLCSQGTMASHRRKKLSRPDACPWALAAEKVRWISVDLGGSDKNPNFPCWILGNLPELWLFFQYPTWRTKESKDYEKRLQFQAKSTSAQTN